MTLMHDYARNPLKNLSLIYRSVKVQIYPSIETWIKTSLDPAERHLCGILTKYLHTPKASTVLTHTYVCVTMLSHFS